MMFRLNVPAKRGTVLNGVLFRKQEKKTADTVMIAITGIHGNFYSNPFYYNIGDTYQKKHQEVADDILRQLQEWKAS